MFLRWLKSAKISQKRKRKAKLFQENAILDWYVYPGAQPEIFLGRGSFVKLGHFDKHFIKKPRKKAPQGKFLKFFLLDTLKTTF